MTNHVFQTRRRFSATGTAAASLLVLAALFSGCASKPALTHTGFLSDYSRLSPVTEDRVRYEAPSANQYKSFIVEPVKILVPAGKFDAQEREELARYFRQAFEGAIKESGYGITTKPGAGVGRVRLALTDVASSTWWKKIHPVTRATGAGTGGGSMEAEVVDSVTGEQVAAVIQSGSGNQFRLANFSTMADVKSAIDRWARVAAERLKEL